VTRDEWESIALLIENCWRGQFDETASSAYHTFLGELDATIVMLALKRLVQNGTVFRPTPGEIMAAVTNDPGVSTFSEAFPAIRKALALGGGDEMVLGRLEDEHRYLKAWVERYGPHRLAQEPVDDPQYGGVTMHRLESDYDQFCRVAIDRERQGRVLLSSGMSTGGLNKFKPFVALGFDRKKLGSGDDDAS